jgi:hypothetical protein
MHFKEKHQSQGKHNGYKHQHPLGKYERFLSHYACALAAGGYCKKPTNPCSATVDLLIQINRHDPYPAKVYEFSMWVTLEILTNLVKYP